MNRIATIEKERAIEKMFLLLACLVWLFVPAHDNCSLSNNLAGRSLACTIPSTAFLVQIKSEPELYRPKSKYLILLASTSSLAMSLLLASHQHVLVKLVFWERLSFSLATRSQQSGRMIKMHVEKIDVSGAGTCSRLDV
ncbi:hypothetical protein O181_010015 [Austropuccinia psidii MF-1]|uniref:Uncharacterized protein n=1 Tax=Austropuccinia psidii MF-1 TaxID=1389203 RepID=A0A9Q3BSD4_9BASI|nr:hypothetical protein [Austropuccinia psidii MF-1]